MEIQYKGFSIITGTHCDQISNVWNGRYRILDNKGVVVYESFTDSSINRTEASNAAKKSAYEWVDGRE